MGNLQVRFLEGWAPAMAPGHSTDTWAFSVSHDHFAHVKAKNHWTRIPLDYAAHVKRRHGVSREQTHSMVRAEMQKACAGLNA
jgi:hypothetical protein